MNYLMAQGQKGPGKPSPGRSALGDSFSDRDDLDLDEALLQAAAEKKAVSREKSKLEVEARKTMFIHVRLNRVHCRVTYQVTLVLLKGYGPLIIPFFFLILHKLLPNVARACLCQGYAPLCLLPSDL